MLQKDITPPRVGSIVESQICPGERFSLIAAVWIVSVVCVCAIAVAGPGLWGHTLYGLRSIQQGVLTEKADPYSFTAPGHRWVNHEWLSEYIYGWTWQNFGDAGLWCWRNLMVVGLFAIAAAVMDRARAGVAASIVLLIYSAMCLGSFCALVRPDDYQSELALLPCHIRGCEYRDARLVEPGEGPHVAAVGQRERSEAVDRVAPADEQAGFSSRGCPYSVATYNM